MTNQEIRAEPFREKVRVALLLDSKEVATILKIAVKTVNKLVRQGKLACVQVTYREQPCLRVLRASKQDSRKTGDQRGLP